MTEEEFEELIKREGPENVQVSWVSESGYFIVNPNKPAQRSYGAISGKVVGTLMEKSRIYLTDSSRLIYHWSPIELKK